MTALAAAALRKRSGIVRRLIAVGLPAFVGGGGDEKDGLFMGHAVWQASNQGQGNIPQGTPLEKFPAYS